MNHFFVSSQAILGDIVTMSGPDVNHMKNVLRLRTGEDVLLSDETGMTYQCSIYEYTNSEAILHVLKKEAGTSELPSKLYLFQGFPKGDKMELIIQKAVELGAYEIVPVMTKRVIVKLDEKKEKSRITRYRAISESAAKQAGRNIIPEVTGVMSFKEAIAYAKEHCTKLLIPYERCEDMAGTKAVLSQIEKGDSVAIFIGPEGGFEEAEVDLFEEAGGHSVSLGKRILRTETAGLMLLSVLMYQLEE